jgi:3-hydroxyisobutyrate dehydrogenase
MENRWKTMAAGEFEHGFAVEWMRKDLRIAFEEAERCGAELPVTKIVDAYYSEIEAAGGGRWDTSSLITRLGSSRKA